MDLNFVNSDGCHTGNYAVDQAPPDGVINASVDSVPTRSENVGHLLPRQTSSPHGKKPSIFNRRRMLAISPGHLLYFDAALGTLNPPWRIDKQDGHLPQRNKLPRPLWQMVIPRSLLRATAANWSAILAMLNRDDDSPVVIESAVTEYKGLVIRHVIQDSL